MKYCKNCGFAMNDEAVYCPNCGEHSDIASNSFDNSKIRSEYMNDHNVKARNIFVAIILSLVTCGIYSIYWQVKVNNEALEITGKEGPGGVAVIIYTILTCGIYGFVWAYHMGVCSDKMKNVDNGFSWVIYIVLASFGLSIVNVALTQDAINNCART